jgi:hypothetical protein
MLFGTHNQQFGLKMLAAAVVLRDQTVSGSENASAGYSRLRTASLPGMVRLDRAVSGGIAGSGHSLRPNASTQWTFHGSTAFNQQEAYDTTGAMGTSGFPQLTRGVNATTAEQWAGQISSGQLLSTRTEPWEWQIAIGGSGQQTVQYAVSGANDVVVVSCPATFESTAGEVLNAKVGSDLAVNVWSNTAPQHIVATNVTSAATLSSFGVTSNTVMHVVGAEQEAWRAADQFLNSAREHAKLGDLRLAYRDALRGLDILLRFASWSRVSVELEEMSSGKYPASFGIGAMRFASGAAKSIPNWTSILEALVTVAQNQNLDVRRAMRGLVGTNGSSQK